jgi:hypothetical protein
MVLRCVKSLINIEKSALALAFISLHGCSSNETSQEVPPLSVSEECQQSIAKLADARVRFVTGQAGGAGAEAASVVYEWSPKSNEIKPLLIRDARSTDPLLFRAPLGEGSLLIERFAGNPSRLTLIGAQGKVDWEVPELPVNVWSLALQDDKTLLLAGWEKPILAKVDLNVGKKIGSNWELKFGNASQQRETHISQILKDEKKNIYLLDSGYKLEDYSPLPARILSVSSDLQSLSLVSELSNCSNAYEKYSSKWNASAVMLSCQPQFFGNLVGQKSSAVALEIENRETPSAKVTPLDGKNAFSAFPSGDFQLIETSYLNQNKMQFTLKSTDSSPAGWKGKVLHSFQKDMKTGEVIFLKKLAGQAASVSKAVSAYSCVLKGDSCHPNSLGLVFDKTDANGKKILLECPVSVSFKNEFIQFEQLLN